MRSAASRFHDCSKAVECSKLTPQSGSMPWICAYLVLDADAKAYSHGGETVMHGVCVVSSTSSVAYGHSVSKVLAFAYIKPEATALGTALEVVVMNGARNAVVLGEVVWPRRNCCHEPMDDGHDT